MLDLSLAVVVLGFASYYSNFVIIACQCVLRCYDIHKFQIQCDKEITNHVIKKLERKDTKINCVQIVFWPVGESHDWHDDTIYYDITTITYLNEDFEGGRTIVEDVEIKPETGKYVEFNSNKKHMVSKLISGERFVLLCWYKNES